MSGRRAQRLLEFESGKAGASVKRLNLNNKTALAVDDLLRELGFAHIRARLRAPGSLMMWRTTEGTTTDPDDPELAWEDIYTHPDGGAVRLRRDGLPGDLKYPEPRVIKSVVYNPGRPPTFANEAFRVTSNGYPVPKCAHSSGGMRQLPDSAQNAEWIASILEEASTRIVGDT